MQIMLATPESFSSVPRKTARAKSEFFNTVGGEDKVAARPFVGKDESVMVGPRSPTPTLRSSTRNAQQTQASKTAQRLAKMVVSNVRSRDGALSIQTPSRDEKQIDAVVLNMPLHFLLACRSRA